MTENFRTGDRVAIVGGGQLGRMMVTDAKRWGFSVTVLDPTPNCPAQQMGAEQIVAPLTDEAATRQLAAQSNFLTFEIEHINTDVLRELAAEGVSINPSPETLDKIKDKLRQKQFLQAAGIPTALFAGVSDKYDILQVAGEFGYPFVVKSRFGGYDGRGNIVINQPEDVDSALQQFSCKPLYVEQFLRYQKELAIMVVRSQSGDIATYPVVETIHKDNICHTVLAPAPIDPRAYQQAEELGRVTMEHLNGAGVFGIEMFMTEDGKVFINEIAPRVHNSGHYTIKGCSTSQFEQHVRAVTGLPLGETGMVVPAAVMINILGNRTGPAQLHGLREALKIPGADVYVYGKHDTRPARKMGHITVLADSLERAFERAQLAREYISI
ncbi:5-(carboxyamino)imidazole ribonucleotide synthase [Candidatus Roizmanbacteria bacterium]|nr:5-(carboxyamino)imidazole ribonucleotide synthase [Candidatus Roizmanbacteria bacterium]